MNYLVQSYPIWSTPFGFELAYFSPANKANRNVLLAVLRNAHVVHLVIYSKQLNYSC